MKSQLAIEKVSITKDDSNAKKTEKTVRRVFKWPFKLLNSNVGMASILGVGFVMRRNQSQQNNNNTPCVGLASVTKALGMGGLLTKGIRNKRKYESQPPTLPVKSNNARSQFPPKYCITSGFSSQYCQNLAAVGKRQWGSGNWWDGRNMLKVDLYDFALYLDSKQVQQASHSVPNIDRSTQQLITTSPKISMTLMLRAQRPLPVSLLQKELGEILSRRLEKFNNFLPLSRRPSSLEGFLKLLMIDNIPSHCLKGTSLLKGTTVAFQREDNGKLTLRCGQTCLGSVQGVDVSNALFDLYLGDQPVCARARTRVAQSVQRMSKDVGYIFE
eukprot:TRINITY_DN8227_c0_g1_i1.p1 TRINITY_DN8227_c0_g1~~TRINITY_DN8227_c0_g1_i1.p1  ORF type:complete len:372 (-),score=8.16 TRINITY_DN8227_c0_g1_i1:549-1532(-)